ncbi:hypothetical protein Lal_00010242 [Lupinus albus]|uniref:Uncharacterized protein n=1 Tax=Lupinus albus TaxID=3870 RepID=A0A6A5LHU4_LUPAL|nr:hypothetical protein Lalb_Chr24g0394271 [Lupinus albus]KAF1859658.1 hypothetical protein Lal_00010242 [Lupinus albus]
MEVGSILGYEESFEELKQKLLAATIEVENMKKVKRELLGLLEMAYKERNEAKDQLQKLMTNLMLIPSISNNFKKSSFQVHATTNKANSSITESNSLSHVSSPIDSSPHEFSNITNNNVVVDSHNFVGYLNNNNQPMLLHHGFNEKPCFDVANDVIDFLSKGKVLPQQGKLLDAVMDAGPLLQTLLLAGPIPTWKNPPPIQAIKVPPLKVVKDFATPGIELNAFSNTWNSFQKPTFVSSSSMLNFADNMSGSFNNIC